MDNHLLEKYIDLYLLPFSYSLSPNCATYAEELGISDCLIYIEV